MNIYWLNPPISTRSFYCDLAWINFSSLFDNHNWITPIIDWDEFKVVEDVINHIEKQPIDILMISNYTWNHILCGKIAKIIKEKHSNVIVVSGGPNQFDVPNYVDYSCFAMGHGEIFLTELFKQIKEHGKVVEPDYIPYLITKNYKSPITKSKYNFPEKSGFEVKNDYILSVVQEAKVKNKSVSLPYETTRGCPYSCTYCEWGAGGTGSKISQKPLELILKEIELFAILGISEIDIIDANFGILKRDVEIVKHIAECKKKYGYPQKILLFGLTKNSKQNKENVLDIIFEAELFDFYFMAIQSTDEQTLKNIKRTDINLEENLKLAEKYKKLYNSSAKVELIMGLPGNTISNFYEEMNLFQRIGNWECVRNMFTLLPSTEAYSEEYRKKYGIKSVFVGSMENEEHDVYYVSDSVINQYRSSFELVVETYSFNKEDFKEMFFMNIAVRVLGPKVKENASVELKTMFNKIKQKEWYKPIDDWLQKMVDGELFDKDITVVNGKLIEDIVAENVSKI
jgi:putative methyltransferase